MPPQYPTLKIVWNCVGLSTSSSIAMAKTSALTQANTAYERVQDRDRKPRGRLRIAASVDYGITFVAPFAACFRETYPEVTIDLQLSDERIHIIEGRFDLSFRVGWLAESSNLARKLLDFEEIAVCLAETFAKAKVETPADLSVLPFVRAKVFAGKSEWTFTKGDKSGTAKALIISEMNNTLAMRAFVAECQAYAVLPDFLLKEDLAAGRLKQFVPDWALRKGGVSTVTPPGRVRSNALRRFLELAHGEFALRAQVQEWLSTAVNEIMSGPFVVDALKVFAIPGDAEALRCAFFGAAFEFWGFGRCRKVVTNRGL
ncbi:DNA-binding transcriptional activator GcvA [Roseovarius gaetbuli]|uniref:DNA-binding transcriptional activator GcvA n=1 Tax=Roseovarius gaetbuli TaxID=1356575 RepID=A0A1X6Z0S8_9RHOB|nr:LysR substrate-binding domain-containing protein [Roseovarius gaetbuli]SLN35198.1 DNA-binding transcriptional activator GcvA [Roseovarius gaetbuli]